ncbi:hypothetical protein ONZ51_g6537 [Trametes cubensis]|uniref:Uncharacterized protein n=1 Tax=Trametes cubensis TaxID=1111947 RepID=A0AAD7XCL0_9APHY|nr:hypothetical protein ONZ51_g6537 [Trametes cubensis]
MPGTGQVSAPVVPTRSLPAPFWVFIWTLSQFLQPSFPPFSSTLLALPVCPPSPAVFPNLVQSRPSEDEDDELDPEDVPAFVGCLEGLAGPNCEDNWEDVNEGELLANTEAKPDEGPRSPFPAMPPGCLDAAELSSSGDHELAPTNAITLNVIALTSMNNDNHFLAAPHIPEPVWSIFSISHPVIVLAMLLTAWLHLAAHLPF